MRVYCPCTHVYMYAYVIYKEYKGYYFSKCMQLSYMQYNKALNCGCNRSTVELSTVGIKETHTHSYRTQSLFSLLAKNEVLVHT